MHLDLECQFVLELVFETLRDVELNYKRTNTNMRRYTRRESSIVVYK